MKILITGCAGFIGANFVEYWQKNYPDDEIIGVDCLTYAANIKALKILQKSENFIFYKTNICDRDAVEKIFQKEKPDFVTEIKMGACLC